MIDPTRLSAPLRWEPGQPHADLMFPHLYGPLDLDAVIAVVAYEPEPGGAFGPPTLTVG